MQGKLSILYMRIESSALIDYHKSLLAPLKKMYPLTEVYEVDNFSSGMLIDAVVRQLTSNELILLILEINSSSNTDIMPVFRIANALMRSKKEMITFSIGNSTAKLDVLFHKLHAKQMTDTSSLMQDLKVLSESRLK